MIQAGRAAMSLFPNSSSNIVDLPRVGIFWRGREHADESTVELCPVPGKSPGP
jgi:hypothetical protein